MNWTIHHERSRRICFDVIGGRQPIVVFSDEEPDNGLWGPVDWTGTLTGTVTVTDEGARLLSAMARGEA